MKQFFCDYSPTKQCQYIDTSGMTIIECTECDHYHTQVRTTDSIPIIDWVVNLFKRKENAKDN